MGETGNRSRAGRPRAVFLDVDGTYADHGLVPAAHADAVRAARVAGHRVLLCTGRPRSMLSARLLAAGFDGLVASAGGYVEVGGEVLVDLRFPSGLARRVLAVLDTHGVTYILEAPDALHGRPDVDRRLRSLLRGHLRAEHVGDGQVRTAPAPVEPATPGPAPAAVTADPSDGQGAPSDILAALRPSADLTGASFGKVTYFESPVAGHVLVEQIGAGVDVLPSSIPGMGASAGEIFLLGVHKAAGIERVARHLGLDRADVVAVGDGLNDLEMLAYAGLGVAIEGADPRVLAVADRTAPGPAQAGLATLFAELGLV